MVKARVACRSTKWKKNKVWIVAMLNQSEAHMKFKLKRDDNQSKMSPVNARIIRKIAYAQHAHHNRIKKYIKRGL